jgi:predicted dehydrogenase
MKKIKAAVVGTGIFGSFHVRSYSEIPYVETVAVCDLNRDRAERIAMEYHIPQVYTDHKKMLAECGCDFISIATPDHLHARVAIDAANAGKNFLIEKPFATTREDIETMREAIIRNKVRVMCDLHNRSSQPYAMAKAIIDSGEFGPVNNMYIRLNDNKSVATDMLNWSALSSVLWFLGSHTLDTISYLCSSRPKTVYSLSRRGILEKLGINTVDIYQTSIEFENGCIAQMENGWIVPNGNTAIIDMKCNVICERGAFNINSSNSDMIQVISEEKTTTPNPIARPVINGKVEGFAPNNIRSFVDALISGCPFNITVDEAADTCLAILAILESAEKKQVVDVRY